MPRRWEVYLKQFLSDLLFTACLKCLFWYCSKWHLCSAEIMIRLSEQWKMFRWRTSIWISDWFFIKVHLFINKLSNEWCWCSVLLHPMFFLILIQLELEVVTLLHFSLILLCRNFVTLTLHSRPQICLEGFWTILSHLYLMKEEGNILWRRYYQIMLQHFWGERWTDSSTA